MPLCAWEKTETEELGSSHPNCQSQSQVSGNVATMANKRNCVSLSELDFTESRKLLQMRQTGNDL